MTPVRLNPAALYYCFVGVTDSIIISLFCYRYEIPEIALNCGKL